MFNPFRIHRPGCPYDKVYVFRYQSLVSTAKVSFYDVAVEVSKVMEVVRALCVSYLAQQRYVDRCLLGLLPLNLEAVDEAREG